MPSKRPPRQPDLIPLSTNCLGGINQNKDENYKDQCRDAQNVWTPNGVIAPRPGSVGLPGATPFDLTYYAGNMSVMLNETAAGVFTSAISGQNLVVTGEVGSRIYVALDMEANDFRLIPTIWDQYDPAIGFTPIRVAGANVVATSYVLTEYYGQDGWTSLAMRHLGTLFLDAVDTKFIFAPPKDITATTVATFQRHWIRFTILGDALTPGITLGLDPLGTIIHAGAQRIEGMTFKQGIYLLSLRENYTNDCAWRIKRAAGLLAPLGHEANYTKILQVASVQPDVASHVILDAYNQWFLCSRNTTIIASVFSGQFLQTATVDTSDAAIGPGAPYDPTSIATLSVWPEAKFIETMNNMLFVATDQVLRWSGPVPYHRVWPQLAFETIEGDNSAVTGLKNFAGRLYLGKQKNIYATVLDSVDNFAIPHYVLQKVVNSVGPCGNNIFFTANNQLLFLAEQGVYALSVDNNLTKPSHWTSADGVEIDRLADFWPTINSSYRQFSAGIDWKSRGVALFSVPTGSSTVNDTTVVWDYHRNTWWFWRGFNAQLWAIDEGPYGQQTLYYADEHGRIYQMVDNFPTDHGADIEFSVTTEPMGYKSGWDFTLKQVAVDATNKTRTLTFEVFKEDNLTVPVLTTTASFSDYREASWGTAIWNVAKWVAEKTRRRFNTFNMDFENLAIKVSSAVRGVQFKIGKIEIGILPVAKSFTRRRNV